MVLNELHLLDFKNYSNCSFSFSPKLNFIYGGNGNGKTNILEAISLLCYTKSFLLNSETDCVRFGKKSFEVRGKFENQVNNLSFVKYSFDSELRTKNIVCNNEAISNIGNFIGRFPLIVLSPYDLKLTMGHHHQRRRNFDILISQISRVYLNDLRKYNKIIKQKNFLLKENLASKKYTKNKLKELLEVWNEELMNLAVKIIIRRLDFLEQFKDYAIESFKKIVNSESVPVIQYKSDIIESSNLQFYDINIIKAKLHEKLNNGLQQEIAKGISLIGPHKDNYEFYLHKNNQLFELRNFASQGEHKTFVISLKLAEYYYMADIFNQTNTGFPVLLLDDIFSELDKKRIYNIAESINNFSQVFITAVDYEYLNYFEETIPTKSFHIQNGRIIYLN